MNGWRPPGYAGPSGGVGRGPACCSNDTPIASITAIGLEEKAAIGLKEEPQIPGFPEYFSKSPRPQQAEQVPFPGGGGAGIGRPPGRAEDDIIWDPFGPDDPYIYVPIWPFSFR